MAPDLALALPAHNEARFIGRGLASIQESARRAGAAVEIVVALNRCTDGTREVAEGMGARCVVEDRRCIAAVRNAAVRATSAPWVATLDADSWMGPDTVSALLRRLRDGRWIGGGAMVWPERWSPGILLSLLALAPRVLGSGVSAGMFWFGRETFEALGGFDETLLTVEDLDFGRRLKALGRARGLRYGTLLRGGITTSCRKFDRFGDAVLFRDPALVRRIFTGRDREAADRFYYDPDR